MAPERPLDQYERVKTRRFRPFHMGPSVQESPVSKFVREVSNRNGYELVSASGESPAVVIYGCNHPNGKITQLPELCEIMAQIVKPGDIITLEGNRGQVKSPQGDGLEGQVSKHIPHEDFQMIYNDNIRLIYQGFQLDQQLQAADSLEQENAVMKDLLELHHKRDTNFSHDSDFGLVSLAKGVPKCAKHGSRKIVQTIGLLHVALGDIEKNLKREGVDFHIYVPSEFVYPNHMREISDYKDMERLASEWAVLVHELGYVGKKSSINEQLDERFGHDGWARAFVFNGSVIAKREALEHYEDAYVEFLENNPQVLGWLLETASDVYDNNVSNVHSELDYFIQECRAVHFQDIAVRRALKRLGKSFKGDHLVEIRGYKSEGYVLNPGQIPFHKPELIVPSDNKSWWDPNSVEAFYQHNKVLLVDPDKLILQPAIECPDGSTMFRRTKQDYYKPGDDSRFLNRLKGRACRTLVHQDKSYKELRDHPTKPYSHFLK